MSTTVPSTSTQEDSQFPLAAQIPLASFTLPNFPPAASHLRSLTLTSDINLSEYQEKHLQPGTFEPATAAEINLPESITHLTLELFSLGFPPQFLAELGKALPNLQSLTLFSCLVDGLSDVTRKDSLTFFQTTSKSLKELHVIDTFARTGFWSEVAKSFNPHQTSESTVDLSSSRSSNAGLAVLEVSYTYRGHHESDFLNRVAGEEWPSFMHPALIGLSLNFSPPPAEDVQDLVMKAEKPEDQELLAAQDGILPFASDGRSSASVTRAFEQVRGLTENPVGLKVVNLSMYTFKANEIADIMSACCEKDDHVGLVGMTACVLLEEGWWEKFIEGMKRTGCGKALESLEIVGVPTDTASGDEGSDKLLVKSEEKIGHLAAVCDQLDRFEMTLLKSRRVGHVTWEKKGNGWGFQMNKGTIE